MVENYLLIVNENLFVDVPSASSVGGFLDGGFSTIRFSDSAFREDGLGVNASPKAALTMGFAIREKPPRLETSPQITPSGWNIFPIVTREDVRVSVTLRTQGGFVFGETIVPPNRSSFTVVFNQSLEDLVPKFQATIDGNFLNIEDVFSGRVQDGITLVSDQFPKTPISFGTTIRDGLVFPSQNRNSARYRGLFATTEIFIEITSRNSEAFMRGTLPRIYSFTGRINEPNKNIEASVFSLSSSRAVTSLVFPTFIATEIVASCLATPRLSVFPEAPLAFSGSVIAVAVGQIEGGVQISASASSVCQTSTRLSGIASIAASITTSNNAVPVLTVSSPINLVAIIENKGTSMVNILVEKRISGRQLYINLNTREIVGSFTPLVLEPLREIVFTRHDIAAIDLQFVKNRQLVNLSSNSSGRVGIKSQFTDELLASDDSWQVVDVDGQIAYHFSLNLDTVGIEDLFPTNQEEFVNLKFEIEWSESNTINTTLPLNIKIYNDVLQ